MPTTIKEERLRCGGCGASAYNAEGDAHGIDPNHCGWMKAVFKMWLEESCH